jgi:hypothetical protein
MPSGWLCPVQQCPLLASKALAVSPIAPAAGKAATALAAMSGPAVRQELLISVVTAAIHERPSPAAPAIVTSGGRIGSFHEPDVADIACSFFIVTGRPARAGLPDSSYSLAAIATTKPPK